MDFQICVMHVRWLCTSRVGVKDSYNKIIDVRVGLYQGSILSPILFTIVLEALLRKYRTDCPWKLLYADKLVISVETP